MKRIICGILVLLMTANLFGCSKKEEFNPETYVKGVLDVAYQCEVEDYIAQTGAKKKDAREAHVEFTKNSGLRLAAYFGIEPDEDMIIEYQDVCEQLYRKLEYKVAGSEETEKGYQVYVEFNKEDFLAYVEKNTVEARNTYQKALAGNEKTAQKNYETALLEAMAAYLNDTSVSSNGGNVQVLKTDKGYEMDKASLEALHAKMYGF